MNCRNKIIFDNVKHSDGKEMLDIIEDADFKGRISLLYTRRPDPVASFIKEGDRVEVIICRDMQNDKIVGFGACAVNELFFNGTRRNIGYLFGLRSRREYQRRFVDFNRGYDRIFELLRGEKIPFYITTILEENVYAAKLLEKKRSFMPEYEFYGRFITYIIKTGLSNKKDKHIKFRQADINDIGALADFLNREGSSYQFFPYMTKDALINGGNFPHYSNFYLLTENEEIIACGALWDQTDYKQYIVKGYKGMLKYMYPFSLINDLFGYPKLTRIGNTADFFTLSFWAVKDRNERYFEIFLRYISSVNKRYDYFAVGIHESNPFNFIFKKSIRHFSYKSRLYLVCEKGADEIVLPDAELIPYLEVGRL